MILVKIHETVVAICDKNLVGKVFEEGNKCLNVIKRFYGGEKMSKEEVLSLVREFKNLNVVGKESVNLVLKEGFINKENIISIKGIPHVQIYNF